MAPLQILAIATRDVDGSRARRRPSGRITIPLVCPPAGSSGSERVAGTGEGSLDLMSQPTPVP
jgi:hypothetical protein